MIRPPSLLKDYTLVWSGDPALELPADETERKNVLRVARETGGWASITRAGERPTLFTMEPLRGTAMTWLASEGVRNRWSAQESAETALRLALKSIDAFGDHRVRYETIAGHRMAHRDTLDALYAIGDTLDVGRGIVAELGFIATERLLEGIHPK